MQVRENLALLLALHGETGKAETLTRHDLPAPLANGNVEQYRKWASVQSPQ